jgi:hypothetical protein
MSSVATLLVTFACTVGGVVVGMLLRSLLPQHHTQALQIGNDLQQARWMMVEQSQTELPTAFLAVLLCWLTILYTAYGLLTPANATVVLVLLVCALSMSGAIFLIVEMNQPFDGTIKISRGPIDRALQHIGQ